MTFARLRLVLAAALFAGWLGWLGYAVSRKGTVPIVSRAQLIAATHLVVAEVTTANGLPTPKVTVVRTVSGPAPPAGEVEVTNLPSALDVLTMESPAAGTYLLPLAAVPPVAGKPVYRIAGLPRSPGVEAQQLDRPRVYPWTDAVQAQLRKLGILP